MQSFSVRDIELLAGIKAHTLRIWQQRYDFFKTPSKENRERHCSNEDLQKLLCLSFLYHNGWKVSNIAALSEQALVEEVRKTELSTTNYKTYVQQLLHAAICFNEGAFLAVLRQLTEKIGFEKMIADVCYPYLERVGLLWNTNHAIQAQEHFSLHMIQNRIIAETEKYAVLQSGAPEIILFCPEKEYNELSLLYLNYLLRKAGWKVLYLGANIKLPELAEAAKVQGVSHLYLHMVSNFTGVAIDDYFETLRKTFPDKVIIASGKGITESQRPFVNFYLLKSDEEIYSFIKNRI